MTEYHIVVDSSVFLNLLDVPGFNSKASDCLICLDKLLALNMEGSHIVRFYLPFTTLLETGSHIADVGNGQARRQAAEKFGAWVTRAFQDDDLWNVAALAVPFQDWPKVLEVFRQQYVMIGIGWGDMLIVKDAERLKQFQRVRKPLRMKVCIWTLDNALRSYSPDQCEERCIWPGTSSC